MLENVHLVVGREPTESTMPRMRMASVRRSKIQCNLYLEWMRNEEEQRKKWWLRLVFACCSTTTTTTMTTPLRLRTSMPSALDCDDDESYPPYEICQIKGVNRHYYTQKPCGNCISPFRFRRVLLASPLLLSTATLTLTAICCSLPSLSSQSRMHATLFMPTFLSVGARLLIGVLGDGYTFNFWYTNSQASPFCFHSLAARRFCTRLSVLLRLALASDSVFAYYYNLLLRWHLPVWVSACVCVCVCLFALYGIAWILCLCAAHIVYMVQWKWIQKQGAY